MVRKVTDVDPVQHMAETVIAVSTNFPFVTNGNEPLLQRLLNKPDIIQKLFDIANKASTIEHKKKLYYALLKLLEK